MRLITVRRPFVAGQTYTLYGLGDIHAFSASCDLDAAYAVRDEVASDPLALVAFMGDGAECITEKDPRWDSGGVDYSLLTPGHARKIGDIEVEWLTEFMRPIADKIIVYHDGNHEKAFNRHNATDFSDRVMIGASIPRDYHAPGMALTRIVFTDASRHACSLVVNSAHGNQAGRMDGAKINRMKQALAWFHCDIMLRGHSHSFFASPCDWLEPNSNHTRPVSKRGYVSHTGSFLRTYEQDQDSYAEDGDYPPTSIGCPQFLLTPTREGCGIKALA